METSSIITQVSRDGENNNGHQDNGQLPAARVNSKPRSFLRTLLCCLGVRQRPRRSASPPSGGPDENGHVPCSAAGGGLVPCGSAGSVGPHGSPQGTLLPPVLHQDMGKMCIVIDLDETLVHSSFKPINNADFIVPVEIDGTVHQVYVLKRPYVDQFLQKMGELFECVLFTASLAKYADPVADLLDKSGVFRTRLFRESCVYYRGNYVKDLERLGRDVARVLIVDNSPASYIFHPDNAVAVKSWFDDMSDSELRDRLPMFEQLSRCETVYPLLSADYHHGNAASSAVALST